MGEKSVFVVKMEDQACAQNVTSSFVCEISDESDDVTWLLDDVEIKKDSDSFVMTSSGKRRSLFIHSYDVKGEHVVTCRTRDDIETAKLTVVAMETQQQAEIVPKVVKKEEGPKLSIVTSLSDQSVKKGEKVTFKLEISRSDAKVTWYRWDEVITTNSSNKRYHVKSSSSGKDHSLVIDKVDLTDVARYFVRVQQTGDDVTTELLSSSADLIVDNVTPSVFLKKPESEMACVVGEEVIIECSTHLKDSNVSWFVDGDEISMDNEDDVVKFEMTSTVNKHSLKLKKFDEDCDVICICDEREQFLVNLNEKVEAEEMSIVSSLSDASVKKGEKATFKLEISRSDAKVTWYRWDEVITTNSSSKRYHVKSSSSGKDHSLVIDKVDPTDVARYFVRVQQTGDDVTTELLSSSADLIVDNVAPSNFSKKPESEIACEAGEEVIIDCTTHLKDARPSWFHNGRQISMDNEDDVVKFEMTSTGNKHSLKFNKVDESCETTCICDGEELLVHLNVKQKQDYLINFEETIQADVLPDDVIRLYCRVTSLKLDTTITWYPDRKEISDDDIKGGKYRVTNDYENGIVSIYVHPIDNAIGKFTCEFVSPMSTFDARINYF